MRLIDEQSLFGLSDSHITYLSEHHGVHHQVLPAWQAIQAAAQKDGLDLCLASSFRSFDRQASIWNRKFSGELAVYDINEKAIELASLSTDEKIKAIMLFSALPGASRHHWGTDIDIYSPSLLPKGKKLQLEVWEYQEDGPMHSLFQWLTENAEKFGFFFPYDQYRGGVSAEPWHLSYAPISSEYQSHLTIQNLAKCISHSDINGKDTVLNNLSELFQQFIINIGDYPNE